MPTNQFNFFRDQEFDVYNGLFDEVCQIFGQLHWYIPRENQKLDYLWGEDVLTKYDKKYEISLFIENSGGWEGQGNLFTKFGIQLDDEMEFWVSMNRFTLTTGIKKPMIGDLIYQEWSGHLLEITFCAEDEIFYHLGKETAWKINAKNFEYSHEEISVNIDTLDELNDEADTPDFEDNTVLDEENTEDDIIDFEDETSFG